MFFYIKCLSESKIKEIKKNPWKSLIVYCRFLFLSGPLVLSQIIIALFFDIYDFLIMMSIFFLIVILLLFLFVFFSYSNPYIPILIMLICALGILIAEVFITLDELNITKDEQYIKRLKTFLVILIYPIFHIILFSILMILGVNFGF